MRVNQKTYRDTILNASHLHGVHHDRLEQLLLMLPDVESMTDIEYERLGPVLMQVYKLSAGLIEDKCYWLHGKEDKQIQVFELIEGNDLISKFKTFSEECLPVAFKYFKSVDAESEMCLLFTHDYVMGLMTQVQLKEKNGIKV